MPSKSQRKRRRQAIHASANNEIIAMFAAVDIKAGEGDSVPSFSVRAYSGGALRVGNFHLPVVVDLAGLEFAGSITANLDHDQKQRVGHVTDKTKTASSLDLNGIISAKSTAATEVAASAQTGYPWQASIEAMPTVPLDEIKKGKSVEVNGQTIAGPVLVASKSKLYGFAFLSRGADENTNVTIAATATNKKVKTMDSELKKLIEAAGFDPEELTDVQIAHFKTQMEAAAVTTPTTRTNSVAEIVAETLADKKRQEEIREIFAEYCNVNNVETMQALLDNAIEGKQSVKDFKIACLQADRPQAGSFAVHSRSKPKVTDKLVEAAMCQSGMLPDPETHFDEPTMEAARREFPNGASLRDGFILAAKSRGYTGSALSINQEVQNYAFGMQRNGNGIEAAAGWSYIDIGGILGNVANKFLANGYNSVERVFATIAAQQNARDYKQITSYALTADATYQKIGPGGEIKHGTLGEVPYANKVDDYGRMLTLTNQDLTNDDLGALTQVSFKLGRGGIMSLNKIFWTEFLDDASFFSVGNNNLLTATTLDATTLEAAEVAFRGQKDPDGDPLGIRPTYLLTGPSLANTAGNLMGSQLRVAGGGTLTTVPDSNIFRGRYTDISTDYTEDTNITGNDATAWWLLADPQTMPVIAIAYLNGQVNPRVESADAAFNVLGVEMRGTHAAGVAKQEFRGGVKSAA